MSAVARTSALDQRDMRSASLPFKRDRDQTEKWSLGMRPGAGLFLDSAVDQPSRLSVDPNTGALETVYETKIRPRKQSPEPKKSHANKVPKPFGNTRNLPGRVAHKVDALADASDHTSAPLSKSLLELLPQHANNTQSAIQTAIRESTAATDAEILYSFDNKGPSPGQSGRNIDLGGLVDIAEKKWANEQTEQIVKGEYEVLDNEGEVTVLNKSKGKKSPKQKATRVPPALPKSRDVEEDDGFELI